MLKAHVKSMIDRTHHAWQISLHGYIVYGSLIVKEQNIQCKTLCSNMRFKQDAYELFNVTSLKEPLTNGHEIR